MAGLLIAGALMSGVLLPSSSWSQERRAPPPKFSENQLRGIFFDSLDDAFRGAKPSLTSVRKAAANVAKQASPSQTPSAAASDDKWSTLISPTSLEDEIKRIRLHYDGLITTPGAFNSGGYQDARLDLTILATLFAIINEYGGDVRWKEQAAAARDLIARTAFNCKAGSTQVYNEAKLRKADLQDLVSGGGITARDAEPENDWTMIADRSPLMEYAESLIDALDDATRNEATTEREMDLITRNAELLAVLGEVFAQEGMDDADDQDYAKLSRDLANAAMTLRTAIDAKQIDQIRNGPALIRQRCDACHEHYR